MSEIITFFRNFQQDQGMTCRLTVASPGGVYSLSIYLKSPCRQPELLSDQQFKDLESYQAYKLKVIDSIKQSDGGFLIEVKDEKQQSVVKIQGVSAAETEAWSPPRRVFCLEPGYRLIERPFDGAESVLRLSQDSHLIVPVDEEAETHFISFRENYSTWFPADFEPVMLNLLRQPTLDLRVARLEEKLEESPRKMSAPAAATIQNAETPRPDNRPPVHKKSISAATILSTVTSLTVAAILTAGVYGYNNLITNNAKLAADIATLTASVELLKSSKPSALTVVPVTPPPVTGSVTEPPAAPPAEDLSNAINELMAFLTAENQRHKIPNLSKLWDTHFSKIQNLNHLSITELFSRKEFLWGMIKLPVITAQDDTRFLENVDAITPTKKVYEKMLDSNTDNAVKSDNQIRDMLSFIICRIQEIEDVPELKAAVTKNFFNPSGTAFKTEPCTNLKIENALPGIVKLKSDLEKLLPASGQTDNK